MESSKLKNKEKLQDLPDPEELNRATGVLKCFDSAFSLIKIYPTDNHSVKKSIDVFYERISEFLDEYEKLIITIGEFSFSCNGEIIFQEEEKQSSLPFFFFKDGMREISFYDGLDKKELRDFLKLIKEESTLALEESDIVNSLWLKDFAHIRFFAIDEFLDTDIGKGGEADSTDEKQFSEGSIELTPEDKIDLYKRSIALGHQLNPILEEKEDEKDLEDFNLPYHVEAAFDGEDPDLRSMLIENRQTPSIVAMANLFFEILFLEERHDQFSATLNVLLQFYKEVVHKSKFDVACSILARIQELKSVLLGQSEEKEKALDIILEKTKDNSIIALLKELFLDGNIGDYDTFFQFLTLLSPNSIPLVGDVWENSQEPFLLQKASTFLQEKAQEDIAPVAEIAEEDRISLTKEIVAILGRIGGNGILPYLTNFSDYKHKAIRLEIIHALSKFKDKSTNKILMKFLADEDSEVRTRAAMNLKNSGDKTALNQVMQLVQEKDFNNKGKLEKKALLNFLAGTKSGEVVALLHSMLKKWNILSMSKHNETRLCAICALETMATPEAVEIIKEGTKNRNKAISNACKLSLKKIAKKKKSNPVHIVKQKSIFHERKK